MKTFFKAVVKAMNDLFVDLILIIFYFFVIGFASLLFRIFTLLKKNQKPDSFWEKIPAAPAADDYFTSGY